MSGGKGVDGHHRWQDTEEHATEGLVALQGHLIQLMEGQALSHLVLVGMMGVVSHMAMALEQVTETLGQLVVTNDLLH